MRLQTAANHGHTASHSTATYALPSKHRLQPTHLPVSATRLSYSSCWLTPPTPKHALHHRRIPQQTSNRNNRTRRSASGAATTAPITEPNLLRDFLVWLVANGVEGIGTEESTIGLYNGSNGERGVLCVSPIKSGQRLATVPLRLAITDYPDDEESNALIYPGAPWSVRLASKLLRYKKQGSTCPWFPYIQVLPTAVPTPLIKFTWQDFQELGFDSIQAKFDQAAFLTSAYDSLSAEATGGASREEFYWALSVVHSRTFAGAAAGGGVGVRMLLPLIDMLNHAGDEVMAGYGAHVVDPAARAVDNVRWDLVCNLKQEWFLVLTATTDIEANEEVLLSYGERANDDFFLFYGFIPPRNPHDDVVLFSDIEHAIDWHLENFIAKNTLSPNQLQAAILAAFSAANSEVETSPQAEKALESLDENDADEARAFMNTLKLASGGVVDGRLLQAFQSLYDAARLAGSVSESSSSGGSSTKNLNKNLNRDIPVDRLAYVRKAVALRSKQILDELPTTLVDDLAFLAAWETQGGGLESGSRHNFVEAYQYYSRAVADFEERQKTLKQNDDDLEKKVSSSSSIFVDVEPDTSFLSSSSSSNSLEKPNDILADKTAEEKFMIDAAASTGDANLLAAILHDQAERKKSTGGGGGNGVESDTDGKERIVVAGMSEEYKQLLVTQFRVYKKMILMDAVLDGLL